MRFKVFFIFVFWVDVMMITDEIIDKVSLLSKLSLSTSDREQAKEDISKMIDYVKAIEELDLDNVAPATHMDDISNVYREDIVCDFDRKAALINGAPCVENKCIKVPKTF